MSHTISRHTRVSCCVVVFVLLTGEISVAEQAPILDAIEFGTAQSEESHKLSAVRSDVITGGAGVSARQLLPLEPVSWDGGKVSFTLKVDPQQPTYFTLKLWGGDFGEDRGRLLLFCEGKQVGYRHIGDVDIFDILSNEPRFLGRFTYKTLPLPKAMTAGKQAVQLEVRALGRIWGYGQTWDRFQHMLEKPSRGIYAAYTHADPCFTVPSDEKQGRAPIDPPVRTEPGPEVFDQLKQRVNREIDKLLAAERLNQMQMQFLARAYHVDWTGAYHDQRTVQKLVESLDEIYLQYQANPRLAESDPATWNASWFGLGPSGDVIRLLEKQLTPFLDTQVVGGDVTRRAGWSKMLRDCRDWHGMHRRMYTNQSMINDLYGIYLANRGVAAIDPGSAWPEEKATRYLYESVGLQPWLGNDTADGSSEKPVGDDYMQLTSDGLTKELGYVGSYGEVLDWVTAIYSATRPTVDAAGDAKIKSQLVKIAKARAVFRHRALDSDGNRCMQLETVVGWRDTHYPGDIVYAQRTSWDGTPLETAAATLDPNLVGYTQQMFDDNQFFHLVQERMKDGGFRVTAGLLGVPNDYELLKAQPTTAARLPMTPGQVDFVFADEEDGVVAIKHGDEILYASLYWRARYAVNFLARVHHITPTIERDATVWQDVQFQDSGLTFTRNDRVIEEHSGRHQVPGGGVEQALQGEVLPIAKVPDGLRFRPGQESVFAGKGSFYTCRYGDYLIGMNCTKDRSFHLNVPADQRQAVELVSRATIDLKEPVVVRPQSTVVLYLGKEHK